VYQASAAQELRALAGTCLILLFYVIRLAALLPRHTIVSSEQDQRKLENHWAGLKDILVRGAHQLIPRKASDRAL
jgi:hypothetical protein